MTNEEKTDKIKQMLDDVKKLILEKDITALGDASTNTVMPVKSSFTTIDMSQWSTLNSPFTYTTPTFTPLTTSHITNMGIGTTGSSGILSSTISGNFDINKYQNKEFETHLPGLHKINEMREMFPGFQKAWDHMRTIYDLVQEEYIERKKGK